jgi:hypothetical protein
MKVFILTLTLMISSFAWSTPEKGLKGIGPDEHMECQCEGCSPASCAEILRKDQRVGDKPIPKKNKTQTAETTATSKE